MLSERLKQLRQNKGYTQDFMSNQLGISRVAYTKYEGGKNSPSPDKLQKLADIFEVSVDYLLGRIDDPTPYRNVDSDLDQERDLDGELEKLLNDEELAAFYDFANMDEATKKEIIQFIKFKKVQE